MPDSTSAPRRRASGTAKLLAAIGWAATVGLVLGPLLAWLRLVPPLAGFLTYVAAGGWAAVASLLGVIAAARGFGMRSGVVVALLASSVFVASVVLAVAGPGHRGAPR